VVLAAAAAAVAAAVRHGDVRGRGARHAPIRLGAHGMRTIKEA
jgi:hypothetical protein